MKGNRGAFLILLLLAAIFALATFRGAMLSHEMNRP